VSAYRLPETKEERDVFLKTMRTEISKNVKLLKIREDIKAFCKDYPLQ